MQFSRAFVRGFWDGVCAPMFLFETPSYRAWKPWPAFSVSSEADRLLDLLLGKPQAKQLPGPSSNLESAENSIRPADTKISPRWTEALTSPQSIEQLEQIVPGAADRLLKLVEQEQATRNERRLLLIDQRRVALTSAGTDTARGQWMGFILVLIAIFTGAFTSLLGGPWQLSVALVSLPLLGAVRAFADRHRDRRS